jgi:hypothetical protein
MNQDNQMIVEIHNIVKDSNNLVLIIGKESTSYSPLYNYPIQSSDIDIMFQIYYIDYCYHDDKNDKTRK